MATAMITGLLEKGIVQQEEIYVTNSGNQSKLKQLKQQYGIQVTYDIEKLIQDSNMVILAVKPKDAAQALSKIKPYFTDDLFIVSVMAGISINFIAEQLKTNGAVARAMPNTSVTIGKSATALSFNDHTTIEQQKLAISIFSAVGMTTVVKEHDLDAITGLSGSGPAYVYYVAEAMEKAAEKIGLESHTAQSLITQTLIGAAEMLAKSGKTAAELRRDVTSPGGTTEAGISVLQQQKVAESFIECIEAATDQSKKLQQ